MTDPITSLAEPTPGAPPVARSTFWFAIIAGLATALVTIFFIEGVQVELWPLPDGLDRADPAAAAAIPTIVHVVQVGSWIVGAFLGSWVVQSMTRRAQPGLVVVAAVLAVVALNAAVLALPTLVIIGGLVGPLLAHLLAQQLAERRI